MRRQASRWWLYLAILFAWAIYWYFMWAGKPGNLPGYGSYLDYQAEGFRAGHLHLPLAPAPELLNAKDPYDRVNIRYWMLDASYYKGKYHVYWGPVPSLIQAGVKSLFGIHRIIGDQYITLVSSMLGVWAGALIIERMGSRFFSNAPRWLLALCILAFACASPNLHLATTAGTYCAAISAGQAGLILGVLPAFDAVWYGGTPKHRRWRLVAAGVAWGLALGSRMSVLPALAILVPLTGVAAGWSCQRRWLRILEDVLLVGIPVAIAGIGLLVFNKLRFDNWFEFGSRLQLSAFPIFRVEAKYIIPNLYSYALRSPELTCQFPYVRQQWSPGPSVFPAGFKLPTDYQILEPVIGWVRVIPLTWLIPAVLLRLRRRSAAPSVTFRTYLWCALTFAVMASAAGMVVLGLYGATIRYLNDITYGLVLLAILGALTLKKHRFGEYVPKFATSLVAVLATASMIMGLLVGYQGYNNHFHRFNPELDAKIVKALSFCGTPQSTPR